MSTTRQLRPEIKAIIEMLAEACIDDFEIEAAEELVVDVGDRTVDPRGPIKSGPRFVQVLTSTGKSDN